MPDLTNQTKADTYDQLLVLPQTVDGTLRRLTDGLGNSTSISVSTVAAKIHGDLYIGDYLVLRGATGKIEMLSGGQWRSLELVAAPDGVTGTTKVESVV